MIRKKSRALQLIWRKTKRFLEWLFYATFDSAILLRQKHSPDEDVVVIVQLKLLGDFILWLPYGKALTEHAESLQKKVIIVVNIIVKPLAELLFPNHSVIGINRTSFTQNLLERKAVLRQLRSLRAGITYMDTCPRDGIVEDATVHALGAPAWSFDPTFPDRPWIDCWGSRRLYTRLLPSVNDVHQSMRHRTFLNAVGVENHRLKPVPDLTFGSARPHPGPYFVIAPGTSRDEKRWPTKHFIEVAQRILSNSPDWKLVVLGNRAEQVIGDEIVQAIGHDTQNYAGATDLLAFVNWIAHAELVIGNDSAACHIAAACGVASFPIVGGGHPGWFFPYPPDSLVTHIPNTINEPMSCYGCDWLCHYKVGNHEPFPCIARITPDRVWKEISATLALDKTPITGEPNASHSTNF